MVPVVLVTRYFQVRVRDAERASRQAVGLQNTHLQEMLGGVEVIRALGSEAAFIAGSGPHCTTGWPRTIAPVYSALYIPLMVILSTLAMALVLWVGVAGQGLLASLDLSLGTLRLCPALAALFCADYEPGQRVADRPGSPGGAGAHLPGAGAPVRGAAPGAHASLLRSTAAIEMREVCFGCPTAQCCVACRWQRSQGAHRPGGTDWRREEQRLTPAGRTLHPVERDSPGGWRRPTVLTDDERRRAMGVVLQVVQLFRGTVFDNLTLGDGSVSREAVQRAAAIAGADAFIQALPQGYDTLLGSGLQLSAGQRQLLALTRALVWDPAVLLLDEATAAIDSASEAAFAPPCVRRSLAAAAWCLPWPTVWPAQGADRVLVMEAGQIVEEGSPEGIDTPRRTVCRPAGAGSRRVGLADGWARHQAISTFPVCSTAKKVAVRRFFDEKCSGA